MHPILRAAADRQWGLFTAVDARRAGYGHDEVRTLRATGAWVRLRRGVYTTADRLAELDGRRHGADCLAALLSLDRPDTVISHGSAARLLGATVSDRLDGTVRLTDPLQWRSGRGLRMACAPLSTGEVVRRGPFRLTSMARSLVDCAREWPLEDAVIAMDSALLVESTTPGELTRIAAAQQSWRGVAAARRAIRLADGRAESPLETRGRLRMVGVGLPTPGLQVEIHAEGRLIAVVDAWFDGAAVAVEFDGKVKYTDPWRGRTPERVLWNEKRREDELRSLDIRVVRVADEDIGATWPRIERRLRELLAVPGPTRRRFTTTPRARGRRRSA
ncbi:type IV toxin-antitoxin system AbiEi family antitoxin domain-containing protein [Geodermatophilus sp. DSM 44513]|uniref:type IV toxin-antitoxin system AbiEi family antitoxin domain-containing protein n=1 Tax=Geodermatophilus sp. DSM 44513 TaxID=1528104 RepID=UPI00126B01C4|nr:type IV toxin-antitoxin system AbiEi family antitoxin domain-containing protein [Geodermatophilus sp. DSM 44513]WNV75367.1 type IV toxin-antitoxin system AbiEi family antitoxin domain-containing protein [Geodermatophilus sp. DSM 44513]